MLEHNDESIEWVRRDGLYHGSRRVRAKQESGKWFLSPDETDLIKALGTSSFSEDANRADLKSRFGLIIKTEIGPVIRKEVKYEMVDLWGEQSRPHYPKKYEKLTNYFSNKEALWFTPLIVIFFHAIINYKVMSAFSSKLRGWFVAIEFILLMLVMLFFKNGMVFFEGNFANNIFFIWLSFPLALSMLAVALSEKAPEIRHY